MAKKRKSAPKKTPTKTIKKPSTKGTSAPRSRTASQRLKPKTGEVIIRCYRQGLGDCYLLAFGSKQGVRYILIDCGVHRRQTDGTKRLMQVMNNIVKMTKHLHVVVATHEHADHLSGFVQKNSPFLKDTMTIDDVWLAWTENPLDPQATELRKKHAIAQSILDKAVEKTVKKANQDLGMSELAKTLETARSFEGVEEEASDEDAVLEYIQKLSKNDSEKSSILDQLYNHSKNNDMNLLGAAKKIKTKPSSNELALGVLMMKGEPKFFEPGDTVRIPEVSDARAYTLGPPKKDLKLLKKDHASKVRGKNEYKETYLSSVSSTQAFGMSPALHDDLSQIWNDLELPFSFRYRKPKGQRFDHDLYRRYQEHDSWRQIESNWLHSAEQLALNLDNDTNNTSLVLAFELGTPGKGPVLLFPGDAQVGNWLSWRDQVYESEGAASSADDLMSRTLFYKAGHHASHNATIKRDSGETTSDYPLGVPFGLELMRDIIVSIPVDRDAVNKAMPTPWAMPHEPLYKALREKAKRRVLRSDQELEPLKRNENEDDLIPKKTDWTKVPGMSSAQWRRSNENFKSGTKGPLFYDVLISIKQQ